MTESATSPTLHAEPSPAAPLKAKLLRPVVLIPAAVAVVGFAAAGVAAGVSNAAQASAQASASAEASLQQTVFLQQWHEHFTGAKDDAESNAEYVSLGHHVCDSYRAGTSFIGEVAYLQSVSDGAWTAGDAGAVIGMSTASFCPEFNGRH